MAAGSSGRKGTIRGRFWGVWPVGRALHRAGAMFMRFFFFQAEDGIRDLTVTGVQTCALPILRASDRALADDARRVSRDRRDGRRRDHLGDAPPGARTGPTARPRRQSRLARLGLADRKSVVEGKSLSAGWRTHDEKQQYTARQA